MRTEIDRATIPADLLPAVERLAGFLDAKLQVFESYDIDVRWSGALAFGVPSVLLRLGVRDDEGRLRWAEDQFFVPSFFEDSDSNMQRRVGDTIFRFIDLLSEVSRDHLRQMRERLLRREPVTVEG